jgi:phospholipid/cholesterol/gamma-HCH transport system permease protein
MIKERTRLSLSSSHSDNQLSIEIVGELTRATAEDCLKKLNSLNTKAANKLHLNLSQMNKCDSIGLITLQHYIRTVGLQENLVREGLHPNFQSLWDSTLQPKKNKAQKPLEDTLGSFAKLGKQIIDYTGSIKENISYFGEMLYYFAQLFRHPKLLRFKSLCYYMQDIGPKGLPLIILIGTLFGVILTFQSVVALKSFGAEIYAASLVSVSLFKELGPLLTAIIVTGRSASAYAAEISAMQVNQEVDALKVMGMDPVPYLIIPRIIAAAIMTPLLTLMMCFFGLIGCVLVMKAEGYSLITTTQAMFGSMNVGALAQGIFKSIIFGIMIISIGCIHGINCQRNATAVGRATTATMVRCIVMITIMDGAFTTLFYYVGL